MSRSRTGGASRSEIVATVAVVVLVVLAVVALWPGSPSGSSGAPGSSTAAEPNGDPDAADPSALASARAGAGLDPCPVRPEPGTGSTAAATGPLAGVTVPCLGADGTVDVGAALAGRPALINVWASWCAPCREELPALAAYAARAESAPVLTVDVRDDPVAALSLLRDLHVTLPAVTDPQGDLRAALDVPPALPASYVLRADGTVTRVDPPIPFRSADEVAAAVARLGAA